MVGSSASSRLNPTRTGAIPVCMGSSQGERGGKHTQACVGTPATHHTPNNTATEATEIRTPRRSGVQFEWGRVSSRFFRVQRPSPRPARRVRPGSRGRRGAGRLPHGRSSSGMVEMKWSDSWLSTDTNSPSRTSAWITGGHRKRLYDRLNARPRPRGMPPRPGPSHPGRVAAAPW